MQKRVTSREVAKEAGVSRTTISYILNNTEGVRISEETRERVLDAAKRLGYHLDINAQALKTSRSMSIGVVSRRNINESRFTNILSGIRNALRKEKYNILLCSEETDENGFPEYYRLYRSRKIDGIIFISYQEQLIEENADKRAEMLLKEKIPCVFADYHLKNPMANCVDINYYHGAYIATRYLLEKGHRDITYAMPGYDNEQERQRFSGINKAVEEEKGVKLQVYDLGKDSKKFTQNIEIMVENKKGSTAIIAAWYNMAAKTLYYCNKLGIKVPQEAAVISLGWDDSTKLTYPVLSSCVLPLYELGTKCAEIIIDNINNRNVGINMSLPCSLSIEEST